MRGRGAALGRPDGGRRRALVEHLALGALDRGGVLRARRPGMWLRRARSPFVSVTVSALRFGHVASDVAVVCQTTQNPRLSAGVRWVLGGGDR